VRSERVDLSERAAAIRSTAAGLPHPALQRSAHTYAQFLGDLAEQGEGLRRRQLVLVLSTRARERTAARAELERRAAETEGLLSAAGVELHPLDGQEAGALLLGAFEHPGPPLGCELDGVIGRC